MDDSISLDWHCSGPTKWEGAFVGEPQVPYHMGVERQQNGNSAAAAGFQRKPAADKQKRHPFRCLFYLVETMGIEPTTS